MFTIQAVLKLSSRTMAIRKGNKHQLGLFFLLEACQRNAAGDPRQSDQRTQNFHFPIVVHQSLDPAAQSSAQAPSSFEVQALDKGSESERVDALGLRAVEVIICMITRDFSVISMTSQASLSLSLSLSLSQLQKSLTHNIGSASALPIIHNYHAFHYAVFLLKLC